MPLQKTSDTDLVRIDLPVEGEWVDVKRTLGRDDEREVQRRLLIGQKVRPGEPLDEVDAGEMIDRATFVTLEIAIKRWSFTEKGMMVPVTPRNIRALDDESLAAITARLNELYPAARSEEESANLSVTGLPPLSVVDHSRESLSG